MSKNKRLFVVSDIHGHYMLYGKNLTIKIGGENSCNCEEALATMIAEKKAEIAAEKKKAKTA